MHLISALVAGIVGAGGGTAELYLRGTGTRATWYDDFEGTTANSSGDDIPLGTYGNANVYVAQFVRVVVKSSAGVTLRDWVEGVADGCVEVRSDSFTGVNYGTAAVAVGEPVDLGSVLDSWNDSAGSSDWNVGSGGADLDDAVTGVSGIFYSVKAYGAVGDGVTNDRTAIAAANTAAAAAGGGTLFFPPGTYLVGSSLTFSSTVSLLGAGSGISILAPSAAGVTLSVRNTVADLWFRPSTTLSGPTVTAVSVTKFVRCKWGANGSGQPGATACVLLDSATTYTFTDCTFRLHGATPRAIQVSSSLTTTVATCLVSGCEFEHAVVAVASPVIDTGGPTAARVTVVGSQFDLGGSGGTSSCFALDFTSLEPQRFSATGCRFLNGGASTAIFGITGDADAYMVESGNLAVGLGGALYRLDAGSFANAGSYSLGSRQRSISYTDNGSLTIDSLGYDNVQLQRTSNAAGTVTFTTAPRGSRLTFTLYNNQVATSGTITLDTSRVKMEAASNQFTVAADSFRVFEFRSELVGSTLYWVELQNQGSESE
jgi:hypothetical protein